MTKFTRTILGTTLAFLLVACGGNGEIDAENHYEDEILENYYYEYEQEQEHEEITVQLPEAAFVAVAAGASSSFALDENGQLWAWGSGTGIGTFNLTPILFMEDIVKIVSGSFPSHALAIDTEGRLWGFGSNTGGPQHGSNAGGQLGLGADYITEPVLLMENIVAASAGAAHTLALDADGVVWAWGTNFSGQLGNGTNDNSPTPVRVMDNVVDVAAGYRHSVALDAYGVVWTWGANNNGQLGTDSVWVSVAPGHQYPIAVKDNVRAISIGSSNTFAITNDDVLWAWGLNVAGRLGDGTTTDRFFPTQIMEDVAHVFGGLDITLAVSLDGGLYTFGANHHGQMGIGTYQLNWDRGVYPQRVLENVVFAAGGVSFVIAIDDDGNLWSWGRNDEGQLGNGRRVERHEPAWVFFQ
ncbi:MAG: hypothetical protein FWB98_01910 [Defluviitaleaceae bacterium]|nr:hypothetical protein [Defluviitaleaceae bacterium]